VNLDTTLQLEEGRVLFPGCQVVNSKLLLLILSLKWLLDSEKILTESDDSILTPWSAQAKIASNTTLGFVSIYSHDINMRQGFVFFSFLDSPELICLLRNSDLAIKYAVFTLMHYIQKCFNDNSLLGKFSNLRLIVYKYAICAGKIRINPYIYIFSIFLYKIIFWLYIKFRLIRASQFS